MPKKDHALDLVEQILAANDEEKIEKIVQKEQKQEVVKIASPSSYKFSRDDIYDPNDDRFASSRILTHIQARKLVENSDAPTEKHFEIAFKIAFHNISDSTRVEGTYYLYGKDGARYAGLSKEEGINFIEELGYSYKKPVISKIEITSETKQVSAPSIESARGCPTHPAYRGLRLFKTNSCPTCKSFYEYNRAAGNTEKRGR